MARHTQAINARKTKLASIGLVLSAVCFGLLTLPVMSQQFSDTEQAIFRLFYEIHDVMLQPLLWITQFGGVSVMVGAAAALWLIGKRSLSIWLSINATLGFLLSWGLKSLVARPRPPAYFPDLMQREWGTGGNGFPSGHATMVTILALTLWPYVEAKYRPLLIALVVGVCISRISLGVHAPLDVLAGVCVGVFVVSATTLIRLYLPKVKSIIAK